ncbi:hypothetical protein ABZ746_06325 [Streptomyces sp. NPDC020096]
MSHIKRIIAAALVAGAFIGAGALPASAAERGCDRGYHHCRDGFRGDGWRHDRGYRHDHDRDGFRRHGWRRDRYDWR